MNVPGWVWPVTIAGFALVLAVDFYLVARNPREPSFRECVGRVSLYVTLAGLFGLGPLLVAGPARGGEFFAGWITEYSLGVDDLFVFLLITSRFAVPRQYRQKVLLIGIVLAPGMRGSFIAAGAEAVARFDRLFYVFGAFLVHTAWKLIGHEEEAEFSENLALRTVRRVLPTTETYRGAALTARVGGRLAVTPMLIVMVAIGTTGLLFALDSIPAIFGLSQQGPGGGAGLDRREARAGGDAPRRRPMGAGDPHHGLPGRHRPSSSSSAPGVPGKPPADEAPVNRSPGLLEPPVSPPVRSARAE
ncbi:hypothetical protein ACFFMN_18250 [Planobispora siamensis]|uniref:Tellurite resistance protein TerC n=1 Tax=Planobispora siamensis TaxID=936338 RepID=A0A8J3SDK7_9ACTN|nr:hypothetical protein [Planobispora siamensis]GIH92198.1 hypothetical protein Psi01_28280 [Planobispora siamensis]